MRYCAILWQLYNLLASAGAFLNDPGGFSLRAEKDYWLEEGCWMEKGWLKKADPSPTPYRVLGWPKPNFPYKQSW